MGWEGKGARMEGGGNPRRNIKQPVSHIVAGNNIHCLISLEKVERKETGHSGTHRG